MLTRTIYGVQCTPYNVKPYDVLRTSYGVYGIVYIIHNTLGMLFQFGVQCTRYNVHYTPYIVRRTVYDCTYNSTCDVLCTPPFFQSHLTGYSN